MAEEKIKKKQYQKEEKKEHKKVAEEAIPEMLIRIKGYDIPGNKNIYSGLTRIKGVSWAISNAICSKLNIPFSKKISELTKAEISEIENFLANPLIPDFMKNHRQDFETAKTAHLLSTDLEMKRDFDIKRLKQIKSYKGVRHSLKLPVRGQRTRSHFRQRGKAVGVKKGKDRAKK